MVDTCDCIHEILDDVRVTVMYDVDVQGDEYVLEATPRITEESEVNTGEPAPMPHTVAPPVACKHKSPLPI